MFDGLMIEAPEIEVTGTNVFGFRQGGTIWFAQPGATIQLPGGGIELPAGSAIWMDPNSFRSADPVASASDGIHVFTGTTSAGSMTYITGSGSLNLSGVVNFAPGGNIDLGHTGNVTLTGSQVTVSGGNIVTAGGQTVTGTITLAGAAATSGDDVFIGSPAADVYDGLGGNDRITGNGGDDTLTGGDGNDRLEGSAGNDVLEGDRGNDVLDGGENPTTEFADADSVNYFVAGVTSGVAVNLALGTASDGFGGTDTLIDVERAIGTAFADSLIGGDPRNLNDGRSEQFDGRGGDDYIEGRIDSTFAVYDHAATGIIVDLAAGVAANDGEGGRDTLVNINRIRGSSHADLISGSDLLTNNERFEGMAGNDTIDGRGGIDYVMYQNSPSGVTVTLGATGSGTANDGWGGVDTFSNIEGVRGSNQADTLTGSNRTDTVEIFEGMAGNDTIVGNGGEDRVEYGQSTVAVSVNLDYQVASNSLGERDTLSGIEQVTGSMFSDTLVGSAQANRIDGGRGVDIMWGLAGDDIYFVDEAGDVTTEGVNEGTDSVFAACTYTLGANVENLELRTGVAWDITGNELANVLIGNGVGNQLFGRGGDDTLIGGGGMDSMYGGAGNDTFDLDSPGDVVWEFANEGIDTVTAAFHYTLAANLENFTLKDGLAWDVYGNAAANVLTGNNVGNQLFGFAGNDTLIGGGGMDSLYGGAGSDTYIVDSAGDVVHEEGADIDLVLASVSYTIGSGVENLTLTGNAAIDATGNDLNNVLTGNAGANRLDGGRGVDTLVGGGGDDVYIIDSSADVITELANEGTDAVFANVTYTLGANVDNLTLADGLAWDVTGNAIDNVLIGNNVGNQLFGLQGNDVLIGGGGMDSLYGGAGNDTYDLDSTGDVVWELANDGIDTVTAAFSYTLAGQPGELQPQGRAGMGRQRERLGEHPYRQQRRQPAFRIRGRRHAHWRRRDGLALR